MGEKPRKVNPIAESRSVLYTIKVTDKAALTKVENIMMEEYGVTDPTTIPNNELIRKCVQFTAANMKRRK